MALINSEVTMLLDRWNDGDQGALLELMPLIIDDLRGIARRRLLSESAGHTIQPTALVNEVYLRLVGRRSVSWKNRAQFFAFVANTMRRILIDHARARNTHKRGEGVARVVFDESMGLPIRERHDELLALDEALTDLQELAPRQGRIVELRFFVGLSVQEVALVEEISPTTVKREWRTAKLWLLNELRDSASGSKGTAWTPSAGKR